MPVSAAVSPTRPPSRRTSTQTAQQSWTTARCHRLIRPLISKLQALKAVLNVSPSIAATPIVHTVKEVKPEEQPYVPTQDTTTRRTNRNSADPSFFPGGNRRPSRRPRQTYASSRRSRRSASNNAARSSHDRVPLVLIQTPNASAQCAITNVPTQAAKAPVKFLDPSQPITLLNSLKPFIHNTIFAIYLGIFTSVETILTSTADPSGRATKPSMLKTLAARKLAHCILATQSEVGSDDIWYDTAADVGLEGEHLRELVRWHAIEVLRDALLEGLMPAKKNGLSLSTVLIGLCKQLDAYAEAESLLQSMAEIYPLAESTKNPVLMALELFWRRSPEVQYRIIASVMLPKARPEALGNQRIITIVRKATENIERCPQARLLVGRVLETTFGIWGEDYAVALTEMRKEFLRRKGSRRVVKPEDSSRNMLRKNQSMTTYAAERAEGAVLVIVERLFTAAFSYECREARSITRDLVEGFLVQDFNAKSRMDILWEEWYPVSGKIALLLQNLGHNEETDGLIFAELVRSVQEINSDCGIDGIKGLSEFLADCYGKLYYSSGSSKTDKDEMKCLIDRLLAYATRGLSGLSGKGESDPPKTPGQRQKKVFNITPAGQGDAERETARYFIAQLAIRIATEFSSMGFAAKDERWIQWLSMVEFRVVGLKTQTPARLSVVITKKRKEPPLSKDRKGWRWEEGIDAWVAVGGTPGRPLKEKKSKRRVLERVVVGVGKGQRNRRWREEYSVFEDDADDEFQSEGEEPPTIIDQDEELSDRPSTSFSSSPHSVNSESSASSCTEAEEEDNPFDSSSNSSASDFESEEEYKPQISPPRSVALRRSPHSTQRIKRSLQAFVVIPPSASPIFTGRRMAMAGRRVSGPFGLASSPLAGSGLRKVQRAASDCEDDSRKTPLKAKSRNKVQKRTYPESESSSEEENDTSIITIGDDSFEDELSFSGVGAHVVMPAIKKKAAKPVKRARVQLRTRTSPRREEYSDDELA